MMRNINNNELLKYEIAQKLRNAMSRFDQTIKWNIAFHVIFSNISLYGYLSLLNLIEIDNKITKAFIKRDNDIENFVHNSSGFVKIHKVVVNIYKYIPARAVSSCISTPKSLAGKKAIINLQTKMKNVLCGVSSQHHIQHKKILNV